MAGNSPRGEEVGAGYVTLTVKTGAMGDEIKQELETAGDEGGRAGGDKAASSFKKELGGKLKGAGVAVGVAAGAALASGVSQAMNQSGLVGSIQAQIGVGAEEAGKIAEAASGAYSSGWGESLDEMGNSAAVLSQALTDVGGGGDLEKMTVNATAMAATFEQDAVSLATSAAALVKNGMAKNMEDALDVMAKGFQSNALMSEDMLDSVDEYGSAFKTLGLDAADVMGLMNQGIDAGAWNGDVIADGLREFMILGQEMPEATAGAFEAVGLNAAEMQKSIAAGGPGAKAALQTTLDALRNIEDPAVRTSAAVGMFGTKAEEMQSALLALDPSTAAAGLGTVAGAADELTNNAMGMDQIIGSLGRTLNEGLGAALTPLMPQLVDMANVGLGFFRWMAEHPVITQILLGVGLAIGAITGAMWLFNAAMLANPATWIFGGIMLAIVALVAGVIWLVDNWDLAMRAVSHVGMTALNGLIHGVNGLVHALNGIARAAEFLLSMGGLLGDWNWGEIPLIGLNEVPGLATGGTVTGSGTVMVGEQGPELLRLPTGASVIPLDHPASGVGGGGGGSNVYITQNNPVAERGSSSLKSSGQLIGAALV